jgi:tetratricopeptide (TPR) repeat protein
MKVSKIISTNMLLSSHRCEVTRRVSRMGTTKLVAICALAGILFSACASSHLARGNRALEEKNYPRAVAELRAAIKQNPRNTAAIRDLGITLCEMKAYEKAVLILQQAQKQDSTDGLTRLYLGEAYEQSGQLEQAIAVYRDYSKAKESEARSQLRIRLDFAILARLREQARQALANEQNLNPQDLAENSVAVLNFQHLGGANEYAPLSRGLADMVITDLSQVRALTVVERSRMQALLDEMGLGQSGLVEEASAPRVANLLGAKTVLQGSFLDHNGMEIRLDANLTNVSTQQSRSVGTMTGELARFFRLEKNMVLRVVRQMGIRLTPAEEQAILMIPTENLLAFLAYCRGLEARDRGDYEKAEQEFREAVGQDQEFAPAQRQLEQTRGMRAHLARRHLPTYLALRLPNLGLQPRSVRMVQSALLSNPAFSFVNRNRLTVLAAQNLPSSNKDVRKPVLEAGNDFGLGGEVIFNIVLP